MRSAEALAHPNGARRVSRVRLRAGRLDAERRDLERLTRAVELATELASTLELEFAPNGPRYPW
jgi:hypothetical protein